MSRRQRRSWRGRSATVALALAAVLACMVQPAGPVRGLAMGALSAAIVVSLAILVTFVRSGIRHGLLVRRLNAISIPVRRAGVPVRELREARVPFVAGLRRPGIYCPADLAARLRPAELRAVLLHEERHRADRAPARLLLLASIASVLRLGPVRGWVEQERARLEIEADRYAMARGVGRVTLASALVKLLTVAEAPAGALGFADASELRLRALLGEVEPETAAPVASLGAALAATAIALGCLALYLG